MLLMKCLTEQISCGYQLPNFGPKTPPKLCLLSMYRSQQKIRCIYWDHFAVAANEFLWMFVIANAGSLEMVKMRCCSKFAGINAYGIMTVAYLRDKVWCFWDGFCFAVLCEKSVMSIGTVEKRIHHLLWNRDANSVNTLIIYSIPILILVIYSLF